MIANPNFGYTNFDNFLYSFLQMFQCVTLEGWTKIMQYVQESFSFYVFPYFFAIVLIGANFLMNLTLAVLKLKYKHMKEVKEKILIKEKFFDLKLLIEYGFYISNIKKNENIFSIEANEFYNETKKKFLLQLKPQIINKNQVSERIFSDNDIIQEKDNVDSLLNMNINLDYINLKELKSMKDITIANEKTIVNFLLLILE